LRLESGLRRRRTVAEMKDVETLKFLLAVDGSDASSRTVDHLVGLLGWYKPAVEIQLLNVQLPILSGNVKTFIRREQLEDYYRDEGHAALKAARERLDEAGVSYEFHIRVGAPAEIIVDFAKRSRCDQICIGTRGLSSVAGLLLGSVATRVIQLAPCPVLLVR
jgi:nucleotide-binding universal stress UspA family protein